MMAILSPIDKYIVDIIDGNISNPILKRVVYEEIINSNSLKDIFKQYLSNIVLKTDPNSDSLLNISLLLENLDTNTKLLVNKEITQAFIELTYEEQLYLILNLNESSKKIFKILSDDNTISQILKHLLSSISVSTISETCIIKFIESCAIINETVSDEIVINILINHNLELINNDKLLSVILRYYINSYDKLLMQQNYIECRKKIDELFIIKFNTIQIKINKLNFDTMDIAYEMYKLGNFIEDTKLKSTDFTSYFLKLKLSNEQIEYIAKSVHTCIINENLAQAKKILSVVFAIDNLDIMINNHIKWLLVRINMNKYSYQTILEQENELWNINDDDYMMHLNIFTTYHRIINDLKYNILINNDLQKNQLKISSGISTDNVNIKLIMNSVPDKVTHHPNINKYISVISQYISNRTKLQHIVHDSVQSKIKIRTEYGCITCPLIMGSILLHLNDGKKTLLDFVNLLNISESEIEKRLKILMFYNVIICINSEYEYVELYGSVECDDSLPEKTSNDNKDILFTDILMTIESRIIKMVKPKNVHKLELERNIQEFMGTSFCRNIYYNQLDSLKKRYYIEEKNDILQYIP
jgi:hypothetical protein